MVLSTCRHLGIGGGADDNRPPMVRMHIPSQVESPVQGVVDRQRVPDPVLPSVPLRRSQRGWHPSAASLQNIAAGGPASGHISMLGDWDVNDVLGQEGEDMMFAALDKEWERNRFEQDLLYATQDGNHGWRHAGLSAGVFWLFLRSVGCCTPTNGRRRLLSAYHGF